MTKPFILDPCCGSKKMLQRVAIKLFEFSCFPYIIACANDKESINVATRYRELYKEDGQLIIGVMSRLVLFMQEKGCSEEEVKKALTIMADKAIKVYYKE